MLKPFEVMFLTVVDQSVSNKLVEKIKEMILSKGEIESFDAWGEKRILNAESKEINGLCYLLQFKLDEKNMLKVNEFCRGEENILRYMIIRKGE